jgi:hypothetical protein
MHLLTAPKSVISTYTNASQFVTLHRILEMSGPFCLHSRIIVYAYLLQIYFRRIYPTFTHSLSLRLNPNLFPVISAKHRNPLGMPKFGSVRFSETFLRTANLNLLVGRERVEPRTRTDRTRFGRFGSGSNRVRT